MATPVVLALTIAAATALLGDTSLAQDRADPATRPAPNVERQVDRLERRGAADPLTRRRLRDQLRREPRGAERSAAERRLERLPEQEAAPHAPLPAPPAPDSLPSSLRPGFGGSGGGPGVGGHVVPPGGRSGAVR